ncbi:LexA family protein [Zooshikella sp. RANM57]|uniref:LexA family protein n=1 Tax=Zooshikella sp. RANM57 TaxID=3425863 RepID=UPI003D6F5C54
MSTLGKRLKERRKSLGLTQGQIAEAIGISASSVTLWERGNTAPKGENLFALCNILNCEQNWLLYGDEGSVELVTSFIKEEKAPLLNWVEAVNWQEHALSKTDEGYLCPIKASANTFVLKVHGSSMEPLLREGDYIFVDPQEQASSSDIVVFQDEDSNEAICRQLVIEGGQKFIKAINPNWPEQVRIATSSSKVIGKVVSSFTLL